MTHIREERRFGLVCRFRALLRGLCFQLVVRALGDVARDADEVAQGTRLLVVDAACRNLQPDIMSVAVTHAICRRQHLTGKRNGVDFSDFLDVVGMDQIEKLGVFDLGDGVF